MGTLVRVSVLALAVALTAFWALPGRPGPVAAATVTVNVGDDWFCDSSHTSTPCTTNVVAGDTVHWVWVGAASHTSTSDAAGWDSGIHGNGFTFDHTFSTPGSFAYHCSVHPNMHGTIVVSAAVGGIAELPGAAAPSPSASNAQSNSHGGLIAGAAAGGALLVLLSAGAFALRRRRVH